MMQLMNRAALLLVWGVALSLSTGRDGIAGRARAALVAMTTALERDLRSGQNVVIHCRQGVGRSGLVAACLFIARGSGLKNRLRP
jgi:predicted protein tyrosine phosphatase